MKASNYKENNILVEPVGTFLVRGDYLSSLKMFLLADFFQAD